MRGLNDRLSRLEQHQVDGSKRWHQLIWREGRTFDEMIADNDADAIPAGDNVVVMMVASIGSDPIRQRDMPRYETWCERRGVAVSIVKPAGLNPDTTEM